MQPYQDWRPTVPGNSKSKTVTFRDQPNETVASDTLDARHQIAVTAQPRPRNANRYNQTPETNVARYPMAFGARQPDANCDTSHGKDESRAKRSASFHKSSSSGAHGALSKKRDAAVTQERHDSLPSRSVHPISSGRFETRVLPCAGNIGPDDDRKKPWFFRMQRRDAEIRLRKYGDGTFIVRPTKHGGERDHCFTLSIILKRRIFHVAIRWRMDNKWALGPLRPDEQTYESVVQMIEYHRRVPIIIHADNKVLGSTCLVCWPLESAC